MNFISYLKDYLYDKNYAICMYDNFLYIYNYKIINKLSDSSVLIMFNDFSVKIMGKDFIINKLDKNELLINGKISQVIYEEI